MKHSEQLAAYLLQINAIKLNPENPFTWASGIQSPIYCDNRITLSYPTIRHFIIEALAALSQNFDSFDAIAGVATAGIPHGVLLAEHLEKPFIYVRSKSKSHGRENQIEGDITVCKRVLVVEDLISTGGSSIQAVETLRDAGLDVVGVAALFTYGFEQAEENFSKASCAYETISNYEILLEKALEAKYITHGQQTILKTWNTDPKNWLPRK